jgi:Cu/Ag efflux pump CusA
VPPGVALRFAGSSADVVNTFRNFALSLGLSIVAIVVVLVLLFRGWRAPLVIVVALPLIGGWRALRALRRARRFRARLPHGCHIFLWPGQQERDPARRRRSFNAAAQGMERAAAIVEAGSRRFPADHYDHVRPRFLGMLPIAVGFRRRLGIARADGHRHHRRLDFVDGFEPPGDPGRILAPAMAGSDAVFHVAAMYSLWRKDRPK